MSQSGLTLYVVHINENNGCFNLVMFRSRLFTTERLIPRFAPQASCDKDNVLRNVLIRLYKGVTS